MAKYRKLGRTASQRKALLRNQVTALLNNGKIVTTEAKAKEIRKQAESLIALAVKEKDNFEEVTVMAKVARKDADGKRVKEVVDGKKVTVYDEVEKTIKKDPASKYAELGISEDWVPVIQKAGYNLVDDLKEVNPQKLHQDICGINKKYKLELASPSVNDVAEWIQRLNS